MHIFVNSSKQIQAMILYFKCEYTELSAFISNLNQVTLIVTQVIVRCFEHQFIVSLVFYINDLKWLAL